MKSNQLEDATCQVEQAQAVLAMWLELTTSNNNGIAKKIGALITLLDGVPEVMVEANNNLCDYAMREYRDGKK